MASDPLDQSNHIYLDGLLGSPTNFEGSELWSVMFSFLPQLDMKSKRWEGEGGSGCMDKLRSSCQSHKTLASTFMWPPFVKFSAMTFALSSGMGSLAMQFPTINILLVLLNLISIVNIVCHNAGKGRRDHHLATMPAALADTIWTAFYLIQLTSNGCP